MFQTIRRQLYRLFTYLAVTVRIDDSPGWVNHNSAGSNDRPWSEIVENYRDALEAWRKNPIAKKIVDTITDYVIGDGIQLEAPGQLGAFVQRWWDHEKNHLATRLPAMVDELTRAGDLFAVLFRNAQDGMSYLRFIPKELIHAIITAPNDWETETEYHETRPAGEQSRVWLHPNHDHAAANPAIMLHYTINQVIGALYGTGDLDTMLIWLKRYSRMLEDRVRLNWAVRAFLWVVSVPRGKVKAKQEQYKDAPESGSIVVKEDDEKWEVITPLLRGNDASHDLRAVRQMIDSGSSIPPHWRGEPDDVDLATAKEMREPAERHLKRRQQYIAWLLCDLAYWSALRAYDIGKLRVRPERGRIQAILSDISRNDNETLSLAGQRLSEAFASAAETIQSNSSQTFTGLVLKYLYKFIGEPQSDDTISQILAELNPPSNQQPVNQPISNSATPLTHHSTNGHHI